MFESARAAHELGHTAGEGKGATCEEGIGARLIGVFLERWFVIEQVQIGRSTGHAEVDHAFGFGRVVGVARSLGIDGRSRLSIECMESNGAQAEVTGAVEELAASGQLEALVMDGVQLHGKKEMRRNTSGRGDSLRGGEGVEIRYGCGLTQSGELKQRKQMAELAMQGIVQEAWTTRKLIF